MGLVIAASWCEAFCLKGLKFQAFRTEGNRQGWKWKAIRQFTRLGVGLITRVAWAALSEAWGNLLGQGRECVTSQEGPERPV